MKNDVIKLGVILALISFFASGILAVVNKITEPIIIQQELEASTIARQELLSQADSFELLTGDFGEGIVEVYSASSGSEEIGYIITSTVKGYGGNFDVITGITLDGKISGVKLGTLNETPGLGAKATEPFFIDQFNDLSIDTDVFVSKSPTGTQNEIIAISGATITSDAVVKGVNNAIAVYNNLK